MNNLTTRGRIILLVVLAALPALALIIYGAIDERARAEARARDDLVTVARLAAREQAQIIEGARQTLVAISLIPSAVQQRQAQCNQYFAQLLRKSSGIYHSMGIHRSDGLLFCNALPWKGDIMSRDRLYFRLAVSSRQFSIGEYQLGRVTGRPGLNLGYPILDEQGNVSAVAFIGIDLVRLEQISASIPLPQGGLLTVIDKNETILARHPSNPGRIGQKLSNDQVISSLAARKSGSFEGRGTDGKLRLFALEPIYINPDASFPLRVIVSIPLDEIYAQPNRTLARNLAGLLLATLLLLLGGWFGAEIFVLRNVRKLLDATRRVQAGRLSARTGLVHGRDELAQLGHAFDEMAQALAQRDADLSRALDEMRQQAITDLLTGLYNRRFLYDVLPRELARARRANETVALIMLDLDHFKQVNDIHGHETGDQVLKAVAALMSASIRSSDYCCRYGGEEIVVVMPEASLENGRMRAEAIRIAVQGMDVHCVGQKTIKVTASLGVAVFPGHGADADTLLRAADKALYEAKNAGRNRVVLYGTDHQLGGNESRPHSSSSPSRDPQ